MSKPRHQYEPRLGRVFYNSSLWPGQPRSVLGPNRHFYLFHSERIYNHFPSVNRNTTQVEVDTKPTLLALGALVLFGGRGPKRRQKCTNIHNLAISMQSVCLRNQKDLIDCRNTVHPFSDVDLNFSIFVLGDVATMLSLIHKDFADQHQPNFLCCYRIPGKVSY